MLGKVLAEGLAEGLTEGNNGLRNENNGDTDGLCI
jgi:hypothetical protein